MESDTESEVEFPFETGVPRNLVLSSKNQVDHIICPICFNILWQPVACSQDRCYSAFCLSCIRRWIDNDQGPLYELNESGQLEPSHDEDQDGAKGSCPKCKRAFKETQIPIINNILSSLTLKCVNQQNGCQASVSYDQYVKHQSECQFRKIKCEGCKSKYLQAHYKEHEDQCDKILIQCEKCLTLVIRGEYNKGLHGQIQCLEGQLKRKDEQIEVLNAKLGKQELRTLEIEQKLVRMEKGDPEPVKEFNLYSVFHHNFLIQQKDVKLQTASYNNQKHKYDFLHFYVNRVINTQGLIGTQFQLRLVQLQGNLLIGICSTLNSSSVDYMLNRQGEIKKKEQFENLYKYIRKVEFSFAQSDLLTFSYLPLQQTYRIKNETKNQICEFGVSEIKDMNGHMYPFFSMDTQNDFLRFS